MSEQSHSCARKSERNRHAFLWFGALTVALSVGFGYSMAALKHQDVTYQHAELAEKERKSLHNRYMRMLGKKDAELQELRAIVNKRGGE